MRIKFFILLLFSADFIGAAKSNCFSISLVEFLICFVQGVGGLGEAGVGRHGGGWRRWRRGRRAVAGEIAETSHFYVPANFTPNNKAIIYQVDGHTVCFGECGGGSHHGGGAAPVPGFLSL